MRRSTDVNTYRPRQSCTLSTLMSLKTNVSFQSGSHDLYTVCVRVPRSPILRTQHRSRLSRLTYVHPCMPVIPLVPSDSPTLISSLLRLSAHHLALAASASQPLKSGTLPLYLSVPAALIPFVVTSRPTTASRPSTPLNPSPLLLRLRFGFADHCARL